MKIITKKQLSEVLLLALRVAVAASLFSIAIMNYKRLTHLDVRSIVNAASSITLAIAAVLGIYLIKSVLFVVPASIIYIYVGMAFETSDALIINLAGIIMEVTLTFWLGRFLGGDYVEKKVRGQKWGEKLLNVKQKNKLSFLFIVRLLPAFPIDFVSLFLGASGIGFFPYFLMSVFGIMPRVILFTILGDGIYDYIPMKLLVFVAISSIPVALIVSLVIHFNKKRKTIVTE